MKKKIKILTLLVGVLVAMLALAAEANAKGDEGFIYGKVYTRDGDSYQGQIRWGKEETYWTDLFNASKTRDRNLQYLSLEDQKQLNKKDKEGWLGLDWELLSIWDDKYSNTLHQFGCQFGEISEIRNKGRSRVILVMKNGLEIELAGEGYNDVGSKVYVKDFEIGSVAINWDNIDKVVFMVTPVKLNDKFGDPLYGTVSSTKGEFTGTIWWDHDENLSTDKLDGDSQNGDISIEFGNIKQIIKEGEGSRVILNSGREFFLVNSNDVNKQNRGIQIGVEGIGVIDLYWKDFNKVTFTHDGNSGMGYNDFKAPTGLRGTVRVIDDTNITGMIIFDLDEAWEYEILDARDDYIEYKIPFRYIKSISPKNYNYSTVVLRNGERLLLGDMRDVSEENAGVLVFERGGKEPVYIAWKKIDEIIFE